MAVKFLVNKLPKKESECLFFCAHLCDEVTNESFNCPIIAWDDGEFDRYYQMHECPYLAQFWIEHGYGNSDISESVHYGLNTK